MHSILITIWAIYLVIRVYAHINKHLNENRDSSTKNISYREDGTVEYIYKKSFLGYASKLYYRKDGSLWKKEGYFFNSPMENNYTLYYPSGRVKYECS